ncbi:hypothetical protein ACYX7E_10065 [Luteimonas sp. RIT-PG2_3]
MRDYGTIYRGFWANQALRDAGDDARTLAAYLLTSPHTTTLGAFRLPDAYACEDLGWESKRFQNGLETLSKAGFIKYDSATKWVWVVKFLEWNRPANPNIWKAIAKAAAGVPDSIAFKDEIMVSAGVSETVSKPLGNTPSPSPSPSPYLSPEGEEIQIPLVGESVHTVTLAEVAEWERTYPRVNVPGELLKARSWSVANPAQRKTPRGVGKFLNGWLSRAADRGGGSAVPPEQRPGGGRRAL